MPTTHTLIIELGTEELPANGLQSLVQAFHQNMVAGLDKLELSYSSVEEFVTPRRLAIKINELESEQKDRVEVRRGPARDKAFDKDGNPTKAASGFASSCGVAVEQLETIETDKGQWLGATLTVKGRKTTELMGELVQNSLSSLPVRKRMRWGSHEFEFVRPVHWLLVMYGDEKVEVDFMGITSGVSTRGHRFLGEQIITLASAEQYESSLTETGKVIPCFEKRKQLIKEQILTLSDQLGGKVLENEPLLNEVVGLVEWPIALVGSFDSEFLELPREVLIATMEKHQKSFAIEDANGELLPNFIAISNLESKQPELVVKGNEKVLQPRLSDAAFFWHRDQAQTLQQHSERLSSVMYQKTLGSMADRTHRISQLAVFLAVNSGLDTKRVEQAARLCKSDLVTDMVGEFPELQGVMGKYYALHDQLDQEVAMAIEEHYLPRFSGDQLPKTGTGDLLALADKLDTLVGIFSIGQIPTGDKDPFGLRRAALGVLRILIEKDLNLDLIECLEKSTSLFSHEFDHDDTIKTAYDYIMERLRSYYQDRNFANTLFDAVFENRPASPYDFNLRMQAVYEFSAMPEAEHLAAANKRIRNILKKTELKDTPTVDNELFTEDAEKQLHTSVSAIAQQANDLVNQTEYTSALKLLSSLQQTIDQFFDDVMVMDENEQIRNNRIALLKSVGDLFMNIADVSRLSVTK